ncbi:MAG: RnfABCDGE type electron transport complex subunit C [Ruminococcus sp.]|nr:RnfABCDGE type electron transport complex subunit C [Ruminococcus sp.]
MMRLSGIRLSHFKNTENCETVGLDCPERVIMSMSQHIGAPAEPLVRAGDEVKVGTKIGDADTRMTCPIHASVSGKVEKIGEMLLPNGKTCKTVEILSDGLMTPDPDIAPPVITDKASLAAAVKESGCCGMGGAGFPTHIKLDYDEQKTRIDTLVINAAECEPYITSDYRELMENTDRVIGGMKLVKEVLGIERAVIGIEENKPKAIKLFRERLADEKGFEVLKLRSSYPQGAEKVIAFYATGGRIIGEGELAYDKGVIVLNASTTGFLYDYSQTGMPFVSRRVTVDGDAVGKPGNLRAPIGTPITDLLAACDTDMENVKRLIAGGPMMGISLYDPGLPLLKTNNAFLAFKTPAKKEVQTACIKCGRCIAACPLGLMPAEFERAYDRRDREALNRLKINLCMNCGSCSYVCPAKRPLAEKNQLAKGFAISR